MGESTRRRDQGGAGGGYVVLAAALTSAVLASGCGDTWLSKEDKREIAAVRAAVDAHAEAVNLPTPTGELPLVVAMRTGSSSLTAWLVARGATAGARNARGETPLHAAVNYDRPTFTVLRGLLARGPVDVNLADDQGATPLHVAAQALQPTAIDLLVGAGADPNRRDVRGRTPLHELGALLLPPDPMLRAPDPKSAASQPAAVEAAMDRLLKAGGRLSDADGQGMRPLHTYALSGNVAALRAALARGADVSVVDGRGQTPLFVAAAFARAEVVSLLLAAGADVSHRDRQGLTALDAMRYTVPTPADALTVAAMLNTASASATRDIRTEGNPGVPTTAATRAENLRAERLAEQSGEVLLAGTYIDDPRLREFVATFHTAPAVALCAGARLLTTLAPEVTATRCRSPRCPNGECTGHECEGAGPPEMEYREVAIGAACQALAFFRVPPGLAAGRAVEPALAVEPVGGDRSAPQWRFRFRGQVYALRVSDRWVPKVASPAESRAARLELLHDGVPVATVFGSKVGDELSCGSRPWLGDLNGDGVIDVVFECQRNTYEHWSGVSLSVPGHTDRRLLLQRETGGVP